MANAVITSYYAYKIPIINTDQKFPFLALRHMYMVSYDGSKGKRENIS